MTAGVLAAMVISIPVETAVAGACSNEGLRTGNSASLPDCRAYEQVSPSAKGGYDAVSRSSILQYPAQAAPSGGGVAYMGNGPLAGAQSSSLPDARVSVRSGSGWTTSDLTPPTPQATPAGGVALGYDFSEDLSSLVAKVPMEALAPGVPAGSEDLYNLFLRHPDGTYSLLNTAAPSEPPPSPSACETCFEFIDTLAFAGASRDFSRVLFEADDSLEGTGAPAGFLLGNLYEGVGGGVRAVGVLPDGVIAPAGSVPGAGGAFLSGVFYSSTATNAWLNVDHAISEDGSKVVFQATADGGPPDPAQSELTEVYDRIEGRETIEVSAPAASASPTNPTAEPAEFWGAAADGSRVLFTSSAELTTASNTGTANNSQDLYRFDVHTGQTTDLTVDTNPADAATGSGVQGVLGVSADASYVYFVATGQLTEGQGIDGQPNVYVAHEDPESHAMEVRFIATLAPFSSEEEPGDSKDWTATPAERESYITPDGTHLAFMSTNSLTGFENVDQRMGKPDSEVYEYDALTGVLECASCDPSGARPIGSAFIGATLHHLASTPFHQPRVLSDDGARLFFSSPDPLLGGAGSPHAKIYEHERKGTGSCATAPSCLFLISSGANTSDDVFLDASSDGANMFFATLSQLAPSDGDNLVDVYDARVGGGAALAATVAGCTSDCQASAGSPPASPPLASGFAGPSGNLAPVPVGSHASTKGQKLARALHACRKKRPRKQRKRCEAQARRRYGGGSRGARASARPGSVRASGLGARP